MTRTDLTRIWREVLQRADELHPAALVALVAVLLGLTFGAGLVLAPALVAVATALVALVKATAGVAAAGLIGRTAVRLAYRYFARPGTFRGFSA